MALVPSFVSPRSTFGPVSDSFAMLHREMNRLFDDVLRGAPMLGVAQQERREGLLLGPDIDLTENDKEICLRAELPGVNEKDIELSLNDDLLTLRAEKKQKHREECEGVHVAERSYGAFQRILRLSFAAEPSQVQARFENGVLTVTMPKAQAQRRSRRIQIQGAQARQHNEQAAGRPTEQETKGEPGVHYPDAEHNERQHDGPAGASPVGT